MVGTSIPWHVVSVGLRPLLMEVRHALFLYQTAELQVMNYIYDHSLKTTYKHAYLIISTSKLHPIAWADIGLICLLYTKHQLIIIFFKTKKDYSYWYTAHSWIHFSIVRTRARKSLALSQLFPRPRKSVVSNACHYFLRKNSLIR